MAKLLTEQPKNLTEYPNSFKRQGAFPLESDSVFVSYEEAKKYASTSPIAYVTQPIGVAYQDNGRVVADYYIIGDESGTLIHIGNSDHNLDEINQRIEEIEKFFATTDGETLEDTLDQLIELQKWIQGHLEEFDETTQRLDKRIDDLTISNIANTNIVVAGRENSDVSTLDKILQQEISVRNDQVVGLNIELKKEIERAEEAEEKIVADFDTKISESRTVEAELREDLTKEIERATAAENTISERITTHIGTYNTKVAELQAADAANATAIEELNADYDAKVAELEAADKATDDALAEETSLREAQINGLNFSLKEEVNRATQADTDIMQALNKEVEDRIANVKAEENARQQAMAEESIRINEEFSTLGEMLNKETSKLDILIGNDGEKSVRTIANEELAAQLLSEKADADFKTLQDLASWLEDHPESVADINQRIAKNTTEIESHVHKAEYTPSGTISQPIFTGDELTSTGKYTPNGVISEQHFSGDTLASTGNYTPEGIISQPTFTGTKAEINVSGVPSGTINEQSFEGEPTTISVTGTPSGTIDQPIFTGNELTSTGKYTPAGEVDVTLNVTNDTVSKKVKDATLSTFVTEYDRDSKRLSFKFNQGSLPEFEDVTAVTSVEITEANFTGTEDTINVTGTPAGTVSQPTFSGEELTCTGEYTPKGSITQAEFIGEESTSTGSYTPEGTISTPSFTGTKAEIKVTGTPSGTIDQAIFTGSETDINVSGTPEGTVSQSIFTGTKVTITTKPIEKEVITNE